MPTWKQNRANSRAARAQNRIEREERRNAPPEWVLNRESNAKLRGQDRREPKDRRARSAKLPAEKRKAKTRRDAGDRLDVTARNAERKETPQQKQERINRILGVKPSKKAAEPQPKNSGKPARNAAQQPIVVGIFRGIFGGKR